MLNFSASLKIHLHVAPVDMRKSFKGLTAIAKHEMKKNPADGSVFVFCSRSRTLVKLLNFDGTGMWVRARRLERGAYWWPSWDQVEGKDLQVRAEKSLPIAKELKSRLHGWVVDMTLLKGKFRACVPGASKKAMKAITKTIRDWKIHRGTSESPEQVAQRYNGIIRGWIEYYGKHWYRNFSYRIWSVLQSRLIKWVEAKYRLSVRAAQQRLTRMQKENPTLFAHWYLLRVSNT